MGRGDGFKVGEAWGRTGTNQHPHVISHSFQDAIFSDVTDLDEKLIVRLKHLGQGSEKLPDDPAGAGGAVGSAAAS